jgi:D-amino-acid dehydrogenase
LGLTLAPSTAEISTGVITKDPNRLTPEVANAISPDRFLSRRALRCA